MKNESQPEFVQSVVTCACGNTFEVMSTKANLNVEICSNCHPFYTGEQGQTSRTGRVDKFNRKYGLKKEENTQ